MHDAYWNPLVPELTVSSIAVSLRFYQSAGFTIRYRRSQPNFAYIELGQAQLMLEEAHEIGWQTGVLERPYGRGINFQIEVHDIHGTANTLAADGYPFFKNLTEAWYAVSAGQEEGQIEFLVQDPDGYLMRFVQGLGSRLKNNQV